MFNKLLVTATLIGSVLVSGASASAGDFSRDPWPAPPRPAPVQSVPTDSYAVPDRPAFAAYTVLCLGSTACSSLRAWCDKEGATYTEFVGGGGVTKGLCSK